MTERTPAEGVAHELRRELAARRTAQKEQITEQIEAIGRVVDEADRTGLRDERLEAAARDALIDVLNSAPNSRRARRRKRPRVLTSPRPGRSRQSSIEPATRERRQLPPGPS
jgi:hypothetical protein